MAAANPETGEEGLVLGKTSYKKGEYIAVRSNINDRAAYEIGILRENYGEHNKDDEIDIMWLKLYQENNPLVFEINNKILTKINGSIIGAVKVDLKMEKYHISKETHDKIRNNFGHVPVEGYAK
ncbi:UNVERIFIED_CONTAM: hypothetical protein RMT77_012837 [Armadillidium vulgare]